MPDPEDPWTNARKYRDLAEDFKSRAKTTKDREVRHHYETISAGYAALANAEERTVLRRTRRT